jgi:hypothetical protein
MIKMIIRKPFIHIKSGLLIKLSNLIVAYRLKLIEFIIKYVHCGTFSENLTKKTKAKA